MKVHAKCSSRYDYFIQEIENLPVPMMRVVYAPSWQAFKCFRATSLNNVKIVYGFYGISVGNTWFAKAANQVNLV